MGYEHHLYADDTQIYTSFVAEDIAQSLIFVQNCMLAIQVWMNQNMLKLNPSKTEFMIIGNLIRHKKVAHIFPVELLNQNFAEIDSIRNLGVAFDPAFSFKKHGSNICRSAFYHIRDLRRIRIHLNKATAIALAIALVSSRLDTRYDWAAQLIYCARPSHTDHHFVYTATCVRTTLALPTKKLGCQEIGTNISSACEN